MDPFMILASEEPSWWQKVLMSFFHWLWEWFYNLLLDFAVWIFSMFLVAIPENWCPKAVAFLKYVEMMNCWINLEFGIGLLMCYYVFLLVFILIKFVLKLIPTVG